MDSKLSKTISDDKPMEKDVTTTFVEDAPAVGIVLDTPKARDDTTSAASEIESFLRRPIIIESGEWTTTQLIGAQIFKNLSVDSFLNTEELWRDKIKGFGMIRATAHLRLQINADPFQSGKLLLHYLPAAGRHTDGSARWTGYESAHNLNLTVRSQQPSVELDARDTVATMTIPYATPMHYFRLGADPLLDRRSDAFHRGWLYLSVLSQLRSEQALTVDYTLFLHFEDVELYAPIVPEGAGGKGKGIKGARYKSTKEVEEAGLSSGPISSALSLTASIARGIATVPSLSAIATPASWVAQGLAGLASHFGYSKPPIAMAVTPMALQPFRYSAVCDGNDPSIPIGMRSDNAVTLADSVFHTDADEMAFDYLKSIPAYHSQPIWSSDNAPGYVVADFDLTPSRLYYADNAVNSNGDTAAVTCGGPIYYLHPLFHQWRGSIRLHFHLAKTDYHSGRLAIVFTPSVSANPTATSLDSSPYCLREIIDVRNGNEFTFDFPYLLPTDYIGIDESIGTVHVIVLNRLRHPESIPKDVPIVVSYCGGPDFEYAVPAGSDSRLTPLLPEGGGLGGDVCLTDGVIGDARVPPPGLEHAAMCVGEKFSSTRQLLTRYSQVFLDPNIDHGLTDQMEIYPFTAATAGIGAINTINGGGAGGDAYSYIAPMYAYFRGGMRVSVETSDGQGYTAVVDPYTDDTLKMVEAFPTAPPNIGIPNTVPWYNISSGPCGAAKDDAISAAGPFSVPYYCRTPMSVIAVASSDTVLKDSTQPSTAMCITVPRGDFGGIVMYRSITEDHQLIGFVGCPPLAAKF